MNRLLQGDVGSGKTVVAALAAAIVVSSGSQAAIMSPTSILAEQHYRSFTRLLAGENGMLQEGQIRLLVGDTPEPEKEVIRRWLAGWLDQDRHRYAFPDRGTRPVPGSAIRGDR